MLDVTGEASRAITALAESTAEPDGSGLRIAVSTAGDVGAQLAVSVAERPSADDEVVTSDEGAKVFLEPEAAQYLTDKVLDVRSGDDGRIHFTFRGKVG